MTWNQPRDAVPYGYEPARQRSEVPVYAVPPVVVNVVQNNAGPVVVRARRVNHRLHGWLTFWTLGMWAPVWIYLATRKPKVYR